MKDELFNKIESEIVEIFKKYKLTNDEVLIILTVMNHKIINKKNFYTGDKIGQ